MRSSLQHSDVTLYMEIHANVSSRSNEIMRSTLIIHVAHSLEGESKVGGVVFLVFSAFSGLHSVV